MPPSKTLSQVFIITPTPMHKEITHSSQTAFSEDLLFPQQKVGGGEGGDYGVENLITTIKPTRV